MRNFGLLLVTTLFLFGCSPNSEALSDARKAELRAVLTSGFVLSSVPPDREEAFYGILEAFAAQRRDKEFVSRIRFISDTVAVIYFVNGGAHGENMAGAEIKNGKWAVSHKAYSV